jgi:hypothetical protein
MAARTRGCATIVEEGEIIPPAAIIEENWRLSSIYIFFFLIFARISVQKFFTREEHLRGIPHHAVRKLSCIDIHIQTYVYICQMLIRSTCHFIS